MYRAVTWWALDQGLAEVDVPARLEQCVIVESHGPDRPADQRQRRGCFEAIRTPEVTAAVSRYSAVPEVRAALVAQQRQVAEHTSRDWSPKVDLGTVVFPDALLKGVPDRGRFSPGTNGGRPRTPNVATTQTSAQPTSRWPNVTAPTVSARVPQIADDAVEVDATMTLAEVIDHVAAW